MNDTDTEHGKGGTWFATLIEGGLPQLLAGPAGKAISRLVGSAIEIPASYFDGKAQSIRDTAEGRSLVTQALAEHAAKIAVGDPQIIERAMDNLLARSIRTQENKDSVVRVAIKELEEDPPTSSSLGPTDDWLTKFERYAEDASSDDLRTMFGKLLAGEIREQGAIGLSTMHLVSMMDSGTAKLVERVLPYCTKTGVAFVDCINPRLLAAEDAYIEQSGFWSSGKTLTIQLDDNGVCIQKLNSDTFGIVIKGEPSTKIRFATPILSRAGMDLVKVVNKDFDYNSFANFIYEVDGIDNVYEGEIGYDGSQMAMSNPTLLPKSEGSA